MKKAIIIGAGTYGQVYAEYLKNTYTIIGYIDNNPDLTGLNINGITVLGTDEYLFGKVDKEVYIFVPIGNNDVRVRLLTKLNLEGYLTPSFIHPQSNIHDSVKMGNAIYILPGTNIMPCSIISNYTMISMGVNIAHHSKIDVGCFFSQGTNIGASIHIQTKAYFGIGSTVMTGVKDVGANTLIGAGSLVIKDVPNNAVVVGVPAKIIKYKTDEQ